MVDHMFADLDCLVGSKLKVPVLTDEQKVLYLGIPADSPLFRGERHKEYDWAVPYFATRTELLFQYIKDVRIFHSWVNRSLATFTKYRSWEELVTNMATEINGQVKNFLVAVRTAITHIGPKIRILIRGSKSTSGSGVWQWMFADFLAARYEDVVIDCYDPCETDTVETREYLVDGVPQMATITKYARCYDGDAGDYDVAIDDAYDVATLEWKPLSHIYSLKDPSEGVAPFLHLNEGRIFSHMPVARIDSPCPCLTCRTIASFSADYQTFQTLKAFTVLLGGLPCLNADYTREIKAKAKIYKQIVVKPLVHIPKPADLRASLMLSSSINMASLSNAVSLVNSSNSDRTLPFSRVKGLASSISHSVCDRLVDKHVVFVGVDPSVLGTTTLRLTGDPVFFANTADQIFSRNHAPEFLWVTESVVYGYVRTGYEWEYFYEYQKVWVVHDECETHFSIVMGVPVPMESVPVMKDVPGIYRLPIDAAMEISYLGWHPVRPFDLVAPFAVDSKGRDSPLALDNRAVVSHIDMSKKFKFACVHCEGGVYHVRDRGSECRFMAKDLSFVCTSPCMHDHIYMVEGRVEFLETPRLATVHVVENGYAYPLRLPASNIDHESVLAHYARHRHHLMRITTGHAGIGLSSKTFVAYRALK